MGQLEDFLQGKPLNDELELLQMGADPDEREPAITAAPGGKKRSLTNDDREWLRRLTVEPGWPILLWMVDNLVDAREESAILLSQTDPIGNQLGLAKEWSYVACLKEVTKIFKGAVQYEINLLRQQTGELNGEVLGE